MRKLVCMVGVLGWLLFCWNAESATRTVHKKSSKATSTKKKSSAGTRAATTHTTSRTHKAGSKKTTSRRHRTTRTTWRNRQTTPTPERYKEIQDALVAKGYLQPEEATGSWNQTSVGALKKFQADQNIDDSGKINSLSLIALGLGPKHDAPAQTKPQVPQITPVPQPQPEHPPTEPPLPVEEPATQANP
ncbi:MAG TPA: peptidoglycan-binding protein [Bryobacteraceae bacterium]|nr:peptidoglycan-binding protein [Bryobacteraceae bacterium]